MLSSTKKPAPASLDDHTKYWSSGRRGGGKVPADLSWTTNPKQHQEEFGTASSRPKPGQ